MANLTPTQYSLKRNYLMYLLESFDVKPKGYEITPPEKRVKDHYTTFLIYPRPYNGTSKTTHLLRITSILEEKQWSYHKGINDGIVIKLDQIVVPDDFLKAQSITVTPKETPHTSGKPTVGNMIGNHNSVYAALITIHKVLGILGVANRDQEFSRLNYVNFNYFDKIETEKAKKFFKDYLPKGFVEDRSDKSCNLKFSLTKATVKDVDTLVSKEYERVDFHHLPQSKRLEIIKWLVRKHTRDVSLAENISIHENHNTTKVIILNQDYCKTMKDIFSYVGIYYFEGILDPHSTSQRRCPIFISLTMEFSEFLKDKTIKKSSGFVEVLKQFHQFLVDQKNQEVIQNNSKMEQKPEKDPSFIILSRYAAPASKAGITQGYKRIYDSETMLAIEATSEQVKKIFKDIIDKVPRMGSINVQTYIRRDLGRPDKNRKIFIISKSWDVPAKDLVLPVGESILPNKQISAGQYDSGSSQVPIRQINHDSIDFNQIEFVLHRLHEIGLVIIDGKTLQEKPAIDSVVVKVGNNSVPIPAEKIEKIVYQPGRREFSSLTPDEIMTKFLLS